MGNGLKRLLPTGEKHICISFLWQEGERSKVHMKTSTDISVVILEKKQRAVRMEAICGVTGIREKGGLGASITRCTAGWITRKLS